MSSRPKTSGLCGIFSRTSRMRTTMLLFCVAVHHRNYHNTATNQNRSTVTGSRKGMHTGSQCRLASWRVQSKNLSFVLRRARRKIKRVRSYNREYPDPAGHHIGIVQNRLRHPIKALSRFILFHNPGISPGHTCSTQIPSCTIVASVLHEEHRKNVVSRASDGHRTIPSVLRPLSGTYSPRQKGS